MSRTVKSYVKVVELSGLSASSTVNLTDDKGSLLDCDFIKLYLPTGASSAEYVECYVSGLLGFTVLPSFEFITDGRPGGGNTTTPDPLPASATAGVGPYDLTPADGFFISSVNYPALQKIFVVAANFTGNDTVGLSADDIVSGMLSVENAGADAFVGSGGGDPDVSAVTISDGRFAIVAKDASTSFFITEPTPVPKKFRSAVYPVSFAGGSIGFALTTDNYASAWSSKYTGGLSAIPDAIQGSVSSITMGNSVSACIAVLTNGNVSSWPWDGISTSFDNTIFTSPMVPIPTGVQGKAIKIATPQAGFGGFILNSDFTISGFGKQSIVSSVSAIPTGLDGRIKDIRLAGAAYTPNVYAALALTTDGYVSAWGNNKPNGNSFGFFTGSAGLPQADIDYLNTNVPIEYRSGLTSIPVEIQNSKIKSLVDGVAPTLFAVETSTITGPDVYFVASAITSAAPFNLTHNDTFIISSTNKTSQTITITSALINPLTGVTAATLASFFNTCAVGFANSAIGSVSAIVQADGKVRIQSKQTSSSFRIAEDPDNENYYVGIPSHGYAGLGAVTAFAITSKNKVVAFGSNQNNLVTALAGWQKFTASSFNTPLMTSSLIPSSMALVNSRSLWASRITGGGTASAAWQQAQNSGPTEGPLPLLIPESTNNNPYTSSALYALPVIPAFGALSGIRGVSASFVAPYALVEVGGTVANITGTDSIAFIQRYYDNGPTRSLTIRTNNTGTMAKFGFTSLEVNTLTTASHPQVSTAILKKTWVGDSHYITLFGNGAINVAGRTTGLNNAINYGVLTGATLTSVPSHIQPYINQIWGGTVAHLGPSALDIASGNQHCLILNSNRQVSGWGRNIEGQCNVPPEIQGNVSAITAGNFWSMALTLDGKLVGWGSWSTGAGVPTSRINDFIPKASTFLSDVALSPGLYTSSVTFGISQSGQASALAWGFINSTNPRIFPVNRVRQDKNLDTNGSGYTHLCLGEQGLSYLYEISSINGGWQNKYYWQVDSSTTYGSLRGLGHSNMDPVGFPYTNSIGNTYLSDPSAIIPALNSQHGFVIVTGENNIIGSGKLVTFAASSNSTTTNNLLSGIASSTPKVKSFIGDTQLEQGLFSPIQPEIEELISNNNPGANLVGGLNQEFAGLGISVHGSQPTIIKLKAPDKANSLLLFQKGNDPQTLIIEYGVTQPSNSLKNITKARGN